MNSKKRIGLRELRVGILVLVSIAILIALILTASGDISLFNDSIILRTRLSSVDGLKKGDEVRLAGVHIGQVESVSFSTKIPESPDVKEGTIDVTMKLDRKAAEERVRTDSTVVLGSIGLLGDKVLEITPGTLRGDKIHNGDFIKGAQETSIKELVTGANDILANFTTLSDLLKEIGGQVREGKGTLGRLLYDESVYVSINRAALQAQDLLRHIQEGDGTIGKVINDPQLYDDLRGTLNQISGLVADVNKGKGTLGQFVTNDQLYVKLNETTDKINSIAQRVDSISGQIQSGQGTAGRLIYNDKFITDAEAAVEKLSKLEDRLDKGEGTAGMLLKDERLYNNLNDASSEIVKLLYDFRQNPKKYLSVKVSVF